MADLSFMRTPAGLVPADDLQRLIAYDAEAGALMWLPRSSDDFPDARHGKARAAAVWNARYAGKDALNNRGKNGYLYGYVTGQMHLRHRVAWAIHHGEWPNGFIDHINGDRTDNRILNLRVVTAAENQRNRRLLDANTSGVQGVGWSKACGKWRAYISDRNKRLHLGVFDQFEQAVEARKQAETRLNYHENHGRISNG